MYKFVKIKCDIQGIYSSWFLVYNGEKNLGIIEPMNEKLKRSVFSLHAEYNNDWMYRMIKLNAKNLDYEESYLKLNKTLYIRPNGVYMTLGKGNTIIEEKYCNFFPEDIKAQIVICENDKVAEYKWKKYLNKRFPNQTIKTINFFDLRSDENIQHNFEDVEYITFSTTFSNYDWFNKLLKNKNDNQKIIGYCKDLKMWNEIDTTNIEIVTNLDV